MALAEEAASPRDEAENFFCSLRSPEDDAELQSFISCKYNLRALYGQTFDLFVLSDAASVEEQRDTNHSVTPDTLPRQTPVLDVEVVTPPEGSASGTFASFGENGTTASVNAYGNIMQITKYLGIGKSGFFCIDLPEQYDPWFVTGRAQNLLDISTDDSQGIGLIIPEFPKEKPCLGFVHNRWPRYKYETEHLYISVEYTIRDGVVIQKYNVEKRSQETVAFKLRQGSIAIRQMEWLKTVNCFNMANPPGFSDEDLSESSDDDRNDDRANTNGAPYQISHGPDKRSLNIIHHFKGLIRQEDEQEDRITNRPRAESLGKSQYPSLFSADHPQIAEKYGDVASGTRNDMNQEEDVPKGTRKPEAVGLVIALFVGNKAQQVGDDDRFSISMPEDSKSLEVMVCYRLQLLSSKENGWKSSLISASETCKPPLYRTKAHSPISFSPNIHLDFTMRRNLEHMLSVCSIDTATKFTWDTGSRLFRESPSKDPAFALMCGDFAGHHIVSSASL